MRQEAGHGPASTPNRAERRARRKQAEQMIDASRSLLMAARLAHATGHTEFMDPALPLERVIQHKHPNRQLVRVPGWHWVCVVSDPNLGASQQEPKFWDIEFTAALPLIVTT